MLKHATYYYYRFPLSTNATHPERQALKSLRINNDFLVLPADKRKATIVLDRAVYEEKMEDILQDTACVKIGKDPTKCMPKERDSGL